MRMHHADEDLLGRLRALPVAQPDATRLEGVRARCHVMLQQRQERAERARPRVSFSARVLEPALVAGLSASYLLAILFVLLRLHGIL
jgi:hypothetical protein